MEKKKEIRGKKEKRGEKLRRYGLIGILRR
jgi:hypothetical protein